MGDYVYYHATLAYEFSKAEKTAVWANRAKEEIVEKVLIPFVNGQVVPINSGATRTILNMKSAYLLTIFKTETKVTAAKEKVVNGKKVKGKTVREIVTRSDFKANNCTEEIIQEVNIQVNSEIKSDLQRKYVEPQNHVFVIMKFGDKLLNSAYDGVIAPIIESYGLEPVRVDKVQNSGKINDQIIDYISSSRFVIADLSGERPNTYYEAGYAHALNKEIILTIRAGEKIHFDLANHRFIQWETENDLRSQLRERLESLMMLQEKTD